MEFLRRHMFVIVCGLVGAGGIVGAVTGHQSMGKVATELTSAAGLDRDLSGLQSKPVNFAQIEAAQRRIDAIVADYDKVIDRAKTLYNYEPLVPDALPYGEPQVLIQFRRSYHDAMNALFDSLSAGTPASSAEVSTMADIIADEEAERRVLALEQGLKKPPDPGPLRDPAGVLTREGALRDPRARADLAAAQRLYCYGLGIGQARSRTARGGVPSLDFLEIMKDITVAEPPWPEDVWNAQLGYWIQKDVVGLIAAMNNEAAEAVKKDGGTPWVGVMPIKDVISIRVPMDFIPLNSDVATFGGSASGYTESFPPGTPVTVFTHSGSGEAYEVIQFAVKLVMDQRDIPTFVSRLCDNSFYTPLRISYEAVPPNLDMTGKIYGSEPAVIVVMDFETVLLGDVFRRLMPAATRDLHGIVCRGETDACVEPE